MRCDGRAYLGIAEHLPEFAPDDADRAGMDESRQVDEVPNYEGPMSRPRPPPQVEVSTKPPRELEESFRNDREIGMDAGRVVCFSMRKNLKKLKIRPLSRLYVVSW